MNTISLERAKALAGPVPTDVIWQACDTGFPPFIKEQLDDGMAEGTGWKFHPLRFFEDRFEIALDNDCILWQMPEAVCDWLTERDRTRCLVAEDVKACFGQFAAICGTAPRNSGIRGFPPHFDFGAAIKEVLREHPVRLCSELDEQGLAIAALSRRVAPHVVGVDAVSICSPFPPHLPDLGRCGAHFVGLDAKRLPWTLQGRAATEYLREHWNRHRRELYARVGIEESDTHREAAKVIGH